MKFKLLFLQILILLLLIPQLSGATSKCSDSISQVQATTNLEARLSQVAQAKGVSVHPDIFDFEMGLGFTDKYQPFLSLRDVAEAGIYLANDVLLQLEVNMDFWPFIDRHTGAFNFIPQMVTPLALENGSMPVKSIRVDFEVKDDLEVVEDFLAFVKEYEDVELVLNYYEPNRSLSQVYNRLPHEVKKRVNFKYIPVNNEKGIWVRDWYKPAARPGLLVHGDRRYHQSSSEVKRILRAEKKSWGAELFRLPFSLDGGDIVVGARHVFVGAEAILHNQLRTRATKADLIKAFESQFEKPIVVVEGLRRDLGRGSRLISESIDYHSDLVMVVALNQFTGEEHVGISSVAEMFRLLSGEKIHSNMSEAELGLAIQKAAKGLELLPLDASVDELSSLLQKGISPSLLRHQLEYAEQFKKRLLALGYKVFELPGLRTHKKYVNFEPELPSYPLRVFNYTNVILDSRVAMVPSLGVDKLDDAAADRFEQLGYTVFSMGSAESTMRHEGGPRCRCQAFPWKLTE